MKITHLGHACVLAELPGGERPACVQLDPGAYATGFKDLTDLDAILFTHEHPDHLDPDRLPALLEANPPRRSSLILALGRGGAKRRWTTGR